MSLIHVECMPDEVMVKKLGFTKKQVRHHSGRSRVFADLKTRQNEFAMIDEDPGAGKTTYEKALIFKEEKNGTIYYTDNPGNNRILVLKGKLEDWIISACKAQRINIEDFGLPNNANALHDVINNRLSSFEKLLDHLLQNENKYIITLMNWLS
jgi:energy-coupling factor transporter ATP-binding protein EcfA2